MIYFSLTCIGKADYLGLNYYTSNYQAYKDRTGESVSYWNDQDTEGSVDDTWPRAKSNWLYSVPEGLTALLKYIHGGDQRR